jgi:Leucine-rich repeat (LRR) protein
MNQEVSSTTAEPVRKAPGKKGDWALVISTLLYSGLFYHQYAGFNFLLFNILLLALAVFRKRAVLHSRLFLAGGIGALVSSFFVFYYSSALAITANLCGLALVAAASLAPSVSVVTGMVLSLISTAGSYVFIIIDSMDRKRKRVMEKVQRPFYVMLLLALVILAVTLLYFFMYRESSPLFLELTRNISLDFISIGWIFFTLGGFFLMYGFFFPRRIAFITWLDDHDPGQLTPVTAGPGAFRISWLRTDTEFLSGLLLLVMLNALLLIVNALDLHYLWFDGKLPAGIKHKEFVHHGVGALITSIVLAIIILLFYFRGLLNFYAKSRTLKALAYLWIVQNIFMVLSTAYRNNMYIAESGLSYKKIGVYVYLLLSAIGLLTTCYKVWRAKSNWSLVRVNALVVYVLLVAGCMFNWDVIITSFNLEKAKDPTKKLEKYYLADIGFKNLPQLLTLPDTVVNTDDYSARDYYYSLRSVYFESFRSAIHNKLFRFMRDMDNAGWPSWCPEKSRVYQEVLALEGSGKVDSLDLRYFNEGAISLRPIRAFSSLRYLRISNNRLTDAGELRYFQHLHYLDLSTTRLDSLEKFPALKELVEADVTSTGAKDLLFLSGCSSLERLHAKFMPPELMDSLPGFPKLVSLDLEGGSLHDLGPLKKYTHLHELHLAKSFASATDTFPELPELRWLDVSDNSLGNERTGFFTALGKLKNLEYLDITNNKIHHLYGLTNQGTRVYRQGDSFGPKEEVASNFPVLKTLYANGCDIRSLSSCVYFKTLISLHLKANLITDISPLAQLPALADLELGGNSINNLVPLQGMTRLESLDLSGNPVRDISPLTGLGSLKKLNLANCYISDISSLASLARLRVLDISNNYFSDISCLRSLHQLESLSITMGKVKDISPLFSLGSLRVLNISGITQAQLDLLKKNLPGATINATLKDQPVTDDNE